MKPTVKDRPYHHPWSEEEVLFAGECWRAGMTQDQVADALADRFGFSISRNSVSRLSRNRRDLFPERENKRGRHHPTAIARTRLGPVNLAQRQEHIVRLWNEGLKIADIAERLTCSETEVKRTARANRDRCPLRSVAGQAKFRPAGSAKAAEAASAEAVATEAVATAKPTLPRRRWPVTPTSAGNGIDSPTIVYVSLRAFSWDEVAA